jgi:TonB family protein
MQPGDLLSKFVIPSNGQGVGGGIGNNRGTGVGDGNGAGVGLGSVAGIGGGLYGNGTGLVAPRPIYDPEPEYSDEARRNKFQGDVVLWVVIGSDGAPRDIRVQRSLGMGLDEKAVAAVKNWRFQPAMKDGRAVTVQVSIEVNFRLF